MTTIILIPGPVSDLLKETLFQKNIETIYMQYENASDKAFNESKYFGTICMSLLDGFDIAVPDAEKYMTKKGNNALIHCIRSRIKIIPNCIVVQQKDQPLHTKLFEWSQKAATVLSVEEFRTLAVPRNTVSCCDIRLTCGLSAETIDFTGHITCGYNVTLEDVRQLKTLFESKVGMEYMGSIVQLTVDEKPSGSIVWIRELGETSHITVLTGIKSSLSAQVLKKYNAENNEFNLKEIDPQIKQDKIIKLKYLRDTVVKITGWYQYVIES